MLNRWHEHSIVIVFGVALLLSPGPTLREVFWRNEKTGLVLAMRLSASLALLKTQASHCLFPAAGFLSMFIAWVLVTALERLAARVPRDVKKGLDAGFVSAGQI